jgi:phosphate transport system substrate-binding protein
MIQTDKGGIELKKLFAALLLIAVSAIAISCERYTPGNFKFTEANYPRMGGSLAVLPLGEAVTAAALGIDRDRTGEFILFEGSTTSNYTDLADGKFDILLAYEPSQGAKDYAADKGFEWEMTPIGRDALVFITNDENKIDGLTTEQVYDIYTGRIKNWSEIGGADAAIKPFRRNADSGSHTLFELLILKGAALADQPTETVQVNSMLGMLEAIAEYDSGDGAIGYTVYYYLTNMESDKLEKSKIFKIDGIEPNPSTIASGKYGLINDFYVVIPKETPADSPARILYNWVCSEQVKKLGEAENYIMIGN